MNFSSHDVYFSDSRELLRDVPSQTIQLVVTSPPYWNARDYEHRLQIGFNQTYDEYCNSMMKVWKESIRTLLPDGKIAVNIGNVYCNKAGEKRKTTVNLMSLVWDQLSSFEDLRFMGTIYWEKSTSRKQKVLMGSYPYPSAFLISTALEGIFVFRRNGYRKVAKEIKELSKITRDEFRIYRHPIWPINGVFNGHPAAYPPELPKRLIKMYSFVGDTVLDPYLGSGTTAIEAAKLGRWSIGVEVNRKFLGNMKRMIRRNSKSLNNAVVNFFDSKNQVVCKFMDGKFHDGEKD